MYQTRHIYTSIIKIWFYNVIKVAHAIITTDILRCVFILYLPDNAKVVVMVVKAGFGDAIPSPIKLASPKQTILQFF